MIGLGIIGLGEAGETHIGTIGIHRNAQQPPVRRGLIHSARGVARNLLRGSTPANLNPPKTGIEGSQLIAVSDVDERRLAWASEYFEIPFSHTNYKELVRRKDVDAVLICTPPAFHAEITAEAARHGKHVFCEKPLAMTSKECEEMIEATEKAGVILQVGYMLRFSSERERIAGAIRSNQIGRPIYFREIVHLSAGGAQPWIHDQRLGGGPLFEASHCIDFVRYVLGEPEFVFGIGGRYKPNKISAVDTYAASFIYPSGDRALICDSYALKNFGWDQEACRLHRVEIDIAGPGGYIQYPDKDQSWQLTICTYGKPQDRIEKTSWTSIWGANGYRSELEHFIDCVRHKKTPSADGYEGLRTVRLCETILHSIETGQVCKFDALTSNNALAGGRG